MKKTKSPQVSPAPEPEVKKPATLSFYEALELASKGNKIHKLEWKDEGFYAVFKDTMLQLRKPDGTFHAWTISEGDLLGDDYVVLEIVL